MASDKEARNNDEDESDNSSSNSDDDDSSDDGDGGGWQCSTSRRGHTHVCSVMSLQRYSN